MSDLHRSRGYVVQGERRTTDVAQSTSDFPRTICHFRDAVDEHGALANQQFARTARNKHPYRSLWRRLVRKGEEDPRLGFYCLPVRSTGAAATPRKFEARLTCAYPKKFKDSESYRSVSPPVRSGLFYWACIR